MGFMSYLGYGNIVGPFSFFFKPTPSTVMSAGEMTYSYMIAYIADMAIYLVLLYLLGNYIYKKYKESFNPKMPSAVASSVINEKRKI